MACNNEKPCEIKKCGNNNGYLIILVLYILLAILLGSCIYY